MRTTAKVPSGSVIYGEGGIRHLASPTFSMAGCSWKSPLISLQALGKKSLRKPQSLGSLPSCLTTTQSPGIGVQVIVVIGKLTGLQGPTCVNLIIVPLAGVGGREAAAARLLMEGGKAT